MNGGRHSIRWAGLSWFSEPAVASPAEIGLAVLAVCRHRDRGGYPWYLD